MNKLELEARRLHSKRADGIEFCGASSPAIQRTGITPHLTEQWMKQMARNVTVEGCGALGDIRYLARSIREREQDARLIADLLRQD
jgi:hypothetical protein